VPLVHDLGDLREAGASKLGAAHRHFYFCRSTPDGRPPDAGEASASRIWILAFLIPSVAMREEERNAVVLLEFGGRALRCSVSRPRSGSSARRVGGRSLATCCLVRRRMNGPQRPAREAGRVCSSTNARRAAAGRRLGTLAEVPRHAWVEELEQAPQLAQVILHGRARGAPGGGGPGAGRVALAASLLGRS